MTDVRLTALNPEDSTVVPVACNSSGELLVDKGAQGPDLNVEGDLSVGSDLSVGGSGEFGAISVDGTGTFEGNVTSKSTFLNELQSDYSASDSAFKVFAGGSTFVDIKAGGAAEFKGTITSGGPSIIGGTDKGSFIGYEGNAGFTASPTSSAIRVWTQGNSTPTVAISGNGSGTFSGDLVVGSRSKSWMLVEQGGLCHMVEQTRSLIDEGFSVDDDADADYPKLRDVFNELDLIEKSLSQVMEKLRLTPPAGWPVWDGSDETQ